MIISWRNRLLRVLLLATSVALTACGGGAGTSDNSQVAGSGNPSAMGTVGIFLTDAPSDRFDKVLVQVTRVELLGGGRPITVFEGDVTVDLRQLETNGELLGLTDNVPPGTYSKLRMYIDDIALVDVADDGVTVIEQVHPKIPANGRIELNPRGSLMVAAGETLLLQIDIDAQKSMKYHATGNGEWRFRPVIFVESGDADDFQRLTRIFGRIHEIDYEVPSFVLCQTELLSDDDSDSDYGQEEHCVDIDVKEDTGLFGESGDPIDFSRLAAEDYVTVAGFVQNKYDDHTDMDEDSDSDSDSDRGGRDERAFEIDAAVVMQGPEGTFVPYKGRVNDGLDAGTGEFTIDLDPDQGIETEGALLSLFQDGTRVFDKRGMPLEPTAIAPDVRGHFEGRLVLSDVDPDVLKAALIVLDLAPSADDVLRGTIATPSDGGFTLMTDAGDRCVATDDHTEVFLVLPDEGNGIRSARGALADLAAGQSVDVYGEEDDGGCFEADTIVVDLTVDVVPPANRAPIANAGEDRTVDAGAPVMLNGSASTDPDGDDLAYAWVLAAPGGSLAELSAADTAMPSFMTDVVGDYVAELTVSDGEFSDSDSVTITATDPAQNQVPVADAGTDATVDVGVMVTLDGTGSSDADGDMLTYSWRLEVPMGSNATLDNATSATPSFTPDVAGGYVGVLTVNDGTIDSLPDEVAITAEAAAQALDGEMLYNLNCFGCHVAFANAPNWSAAEITDAIARNVGRMGSLNLSQGEIQAIAEALASRP